MTALKEADLAGPGIGDYAELETILPGDYEPLLGPRETMEALYGAKRVIEDGLCEELNLTMVQVPLIVDRESGVNDYLDRDGSRTPVGFHIATTTICTRSTPRSSRRRRSGSGWRCASSACGPGEGLLTDMRAVRKDYFLDHDHSAYVDQWDWEKAITARGPHARLPDRDGAGDLGRAEGRRGFLRDRYPALADPRYPPLPDELEFLHAEDILAAYPDLPRKQRETAILQEHPAIFIYGIGWPLADGYPHELRAADYDDWSTETRLGRRPPDARAERRHPRLEPGHPPPARADVGRDPGDEGVARPAARALRPARLPRAPVPPGDHAATRSRSRSAPGSASRGR